jgi:hypothetical protein
MERRQTCDADIRILQTIPACGGVFVDRPGAAVLALRLRQYRGRLAQAPLRSRFCLELTDAESEAVETQVWIEFAVKCGYIERELAKKCYGAYDEVLRILVTIINRPTRWLIAK